MQTSLIFTFLLFLLPSLFAFDVEVWMAKNEKMAQEAARMKSEYLAYSNKVKTPAENMTIPFEMFDTGNVKAVIFAKRGQFFRDVDYIWAQDITVEQFDDDGSLDMRMEAEHCLVDRPRKCCWIAGHVKAHHRKTTLEGDDAFYCSSNNFLKVMSNAKVVSEDVKMKGLML